METTRFQLHVAKIRKKLLYFSIVAVVTIAITTVCIFIYDKIREQDLPTRENQRPGGQRLAHLSSNVTIESVTQGSPTTELTFASSTSSDVTCSPVLFETSTSFEQTPTETEVNSPKVSTPFSTPVKTYSDVSTKRTTIQSITTVKPTTELSIQTTSSGVNGTSGFTLSSPVQTYYVLSTERTIKGSVTTPTPTTEASISTASSGVTNASGITRLTHGQTHSVLLTERTTLQGTSQQNLSNTTTTADYPTDCSEFHIEVGNGAIRTIYPHGSANKSALVNCVSTSDGLWTVIQRRFDGSENFYRNWTDYKEGFGNAYGEYWLGNDAIHHLTSSSSYKLKVFLKDWDNVTVYATYDSFQISDESANYNITISGYHGDAGDSLSGHDGNMFSTQDRDNDVSDYYFCAHNNMGAWWYHRCATSNLNGRYLHGPDVNVTGIIWSGFRGSLTLREATMIIQKIV